MDKLIYTAMTGARQIMDQQSTVANNLANVGTNGFREQVDSFRSVPVPGKGLETRVQVLTESASSNFKQGSIRQTGRNLDVAIEGQGWLAVTAADGREAYTRAGDLKLSPNGMLQTQGGETVLGENGPLTIPDDTPVLVGKDGTVSALVPGVVPATMDIIGRLKLVNPPASSLVRGEDGLFRAAPGQVVEADPSVTVQGGALEDSNVNAVDAMVKMIALGRQFDMQMDLLKNAENNASKASQIMNLT